MLFYCPGEGTIQGGGPLYGGIRTMEMKQVYEALEKVENAADLIAAIKGEINTLNNEAKKHRTAGEQSAIKLKSILEE